MTMPQDPDPLAGLATAAALAVFIGIPMGVYTGLYRDTWLSRVFLTASLAGVSLPTSTSYST